MIEWLGMIDCQDILLVLSSLKGFGIRERLVFGRLYVFMQKVEGSGSEQTSRKSDRVWMIFLSDHEMRGMKCCQSRINPK